MSDKTMTEWTPDQPLRADATRWQVADRMTYLHQNAASLAEATAPFYAVAMVDEVQKALRSALAASQQEVERLAHERSAALDDYARSVLACDRLRAELAQIELAFGNPLALNGLTLAQKAGKCVAMLAKLNAPATLDTARSTERRGTE